MRHPLYLAAASLMLAVSVPSVTYAQPSGTPNPASIPDPVSTPEQMKTPGALPVSPSEGSKVPNAAASPTLMSTGMCSTMSSGTSTMTPLPSSSLPSSAMPASGTMPSTAASTTTSTSEGVARLLKVNGDQVEYNNLIGPAHYIKLSVGSSPLCYLSLEPLQDVSAMDSIKVLDQSGNTVNTVVTKQDNGGAKVTFAQPVVAGSTLTLALQGVEYFSSLTPATVQYSVSGGFADYDQEIPYGIAQVQRFLR